MVSPLLAVIALVLCLFDWNVCCVCLIGSVCCCCLIGSVCCHQHLPYNQYNIPPYHNCFYFRSGFILPKIKIPLFVPVSIVARYNIVKTITKHYSIEHYRTLQYSIIQNSVVQTIFGYNKQMRVSG